MTKAYGYNTFYHITIFIYLKVSFSCSYLIHSYRTAYKMNDHTSSKIKQWDFKSFYLATTNLNKFKRILYGAVFVYEPCQMIFRALSWLCALGTITPGWLGGPLEVLRIIPGWSLIRAVLSFQEFISCRSKMSVLENNKSLTRSRWLI